ncbi:MAG: hypothetical protein KF800_18650 [Lysobacter sp.]|nr:hypothetical protein [Lysobacter sp.]
MSSCLEQLRARRAATWRVTLCMMAALVMFPVSSSGLSMVSYNASMEIGMIGQPDFYRLVVMHAHAAHDRAFSITRSPWPNINAARSGADIRDDTGLYQPVARGDRSGQRRRWLAGSGAITGLVTNRRPFTPKNCGSKTPKQSIDPIVRAASEGQESPRTVMKRRQEEPHGALLSEPSEPQPSRSPPRMIRALRW